MPKQEVDRKSEWFCGVKFFHSNFKVKWEKGVWTKIRLLASCFLFTCSILSLMFFVFSIFEGHPIFSFLFSHWKFFVVGQDIFYFVKSFFTTIWRRNHFKICFLFIRSFNFNWIPFVTSYFTLSWGSVLFIRVIKFFVTRDLPPSQRWLLSPIEFFIFRDKFK